MTFKSLTMHTTVDHHVKEARVVLVVVLVHVGPPECVFHLLLVVEATVSQPFLVTLLRQWHHQHIPRLKIRVLQCQHSLNMHDKRINVKVRSGATAFLYR